MSCDDIGLTLNCVPGAVSGNADVQVAFDSGSASGVLGLNLPSSSVGLESDLLAATPFVLVPAFFAAFVGLPSFLEVACPVAAALIAATMVYAALSGVLLGLAAMPFYAALSGGFAMPAAMLFWAALSDGYGGDACCDGYSLESLTGDGCRDLLCRLAGLLRLKEALPLFYERFGPVAALLTLVGCGENIRFLVLFEMVQCMLFQNDHESELLCTMVEDPGTDVFGILMEEPRMCLAFDTEVRQACESPAPAKSVQILFHGEHGLGVWKLALADWYSGRRQVGDLGGYFATIGGKILDPGRKVGSLGLGDMAEVVFHRRLLGGSFGGVVKGGCLPGTGEWTCSNCGKTDCRSTRYSCYRCGVLRYFGEGFFEVGPGKGVGLQGQGVGAGMSGVRLLVLLGVIRRMCRREIPRTGEVMVGEEMVGRDQRAKVGNGGNRVRFQEVPEDTAAGKVVWMFLALRRRGKARHRGIRSWRWLRLLRLSWYKRLGLRWQI